MNNFKPKRSFSGGRGPKGRKFGGRDSRPTMMHDAVCSQCGDDCQVPFRPSGDKPVLCNKCFRPEQREDRGPSRYSDRKPSRGRFQERRGFPAVCDNCGNDCEVPFRPTPGKPIYCSNCFKGKDGQGSPSHTNSGISQEQFDALNTKIDQILQILAPQYPE